MYLSPFTLPPHPSRRLAVLPKTGALYRQREKGDSAPGMEPPPPRARQSRANESRPEKAKRADTVAYIGRPFQMHRLARPGPAHARSCVRV